MTRAHGVRLEISVETLAGVGIADRAGADRVELCSGMRDGGLTPSWAFIERAIELAANAQVHVLIRPRPGDFRYSPEEISLMRREIDQVRRMGAAGVVVGALDDQGAVDVDACASFVEAAEGVEATFHRAFDVSADPRKAFDQVVELGFTRLLTSGQKRSVLDGAALIGELVARARGHVDVMACGGVRAGNAPRVLAETGVRDLHAATRVPIRGSRPEGGEVSFAGADLPAGFDRFETDANDVAELRVVTTNHHVHS